LAGDVRVREADEEDFHRADFPGQHLGADNGPKGSEHERHQESPVFFEKSHRFGVEKL
jgi:hypothetical protein